MGDAIRFTVDDSALLAALERLGVSAERYTKPAAKITAERVQREAKARVARRTGLTAEGILVREDYTRTGYVVVTSDVIAEKRDPSARVARGGVKPHQAYRWAARTYYQEPHVGLWLEQGTIQGKPRSHTAAPRPFFDVAAELEQDAHGRRMRDAIQQAIDAEGLGG